MDNNINEAIRVLNQGGIIIFPTDTAFGIGCKINNEDTVKRLFKIRKRPLSQAMPILVSDLKMAREYAFINGDVVEKLINPYWPGALTIVLDCKKKLKNSIITAGNGTIGLRMPDSNQILDIIKKVGVPIAGSSANFHGEKTPFKFEDLDKALINKVDFVLRGTCKNNLASTVIDATNDSWKILRQGAINIKIN